MMNEAQGLDYLEQCVNLYLLLMLANLWYFVTV